MFFVCIKLMPGQYGSISGSDLLVFLQSHAGLCSIWSLNEDQLVPLDVLQDSLETQSTGHVSSQREHGRTLD